MIFTEEMKQFVDRCVLCWLATADADGRPNVSPKEIFTYWGSSQLIIANIASPQTTYNLRQNSQVCVAMIDILVQKGYQFKGKAQLIGSGDAAFSDMAIPLLKMTGGKFPFASIIQIEVDWAKPILAPSYLLFPETTEQQQIAGAMETYGIAALKHS